MSKKQLVRTGLLLIIIPLGLGFALTLFSMLSTFNELSQGTKVDTGQMADGIMRSLTYTAIAIPIATAGLVCVVLGLYPRGQK